MIRTKGEAGTGNVVEAVRHARTILEEIAVLKYASEKDIKEYAKKERVPFELVQSIAEEQQLPVVNFAAGGIATPADAALMMQLGMDGVFVGSGIFKSSDPQKRAKAIVQATTHYNDPDVIAKVSENLGDAMDSQEINKLDTKYAERGW
jgi:pyridoxal 5'-phosphate synthase pdxS subunit